LAVLLSIELLIFLFVGIILGAAAIVGAAVITAATPSCSASAAASLQANSSLAGASTWPVLAGASTWPVLYGGETYEVIKFMDANSGQLSVEVELWLSALEEKKRLIEALPFVTGTVGIHVSGDGKANANKVLATVTCCWQTSRRAFKQVAVHCDDEDKPTHLEALHALHDKLLTEHGATGHPIHPKAAERREALARDDATDAPAGNRLPCRIVLVTASEPAGEVGINSYQLEPLELIGIDSNLAL
jgi:hypothetical protein